MRKKIFTWKFSCALLRIHFRLSGISNVFDSSAFQTVTLILLLRIKRQMAEIFFSCVDFAPKLNVNWLNGYHCTNCWISLKWHIPHVQRKKIYTTFYFSLSHFRKCINVYKTSSCLPILSFIWKLWENQLWSLNWSHNSTTVIVISVWTNCYWIFIVYLKVLWNIGISPILKLE